LDPQVGQIIQNRTLGIQTIAACVGIANFSFFFVTQPTHLVEYHVLMHPRCFRTQLNEKSGVDRWFGGFRSNRAVFYGFVVLAAVVVMVARQLSGSADLSFPTAPSFLSSRGCSFFIISWRC
jgi:hypothetical protein